MKLTNSITLLSLSAALAVGSLATIAMAENMTAISADGRPEQFENSRKSDSQIQAEQVRKEEESEARRRWEEEKNEAQRRWENENKPRWGSSDIGKEIVIPRY